MVARADGGSGASWIVTDYSCYSLDDIWASVNQSDTQTWPQIDAWNTMASVCAEQAGQLKLALAQLMQRWVPTSGSAAEAFATTVNDLIAAMQRDATAASGMQPVLTQITTGLADTKDKVQALIDQRDHYVSVEQAHQANPMALRFTPASSPVRQLMTESVPDNWRQDLRAQAVAVMHAGDATIGSATAQMPELTVAEVASPSSDGIHIPKPITLTANTDGSRAAVAVPRGPLADAGRPVPAFKGELAGPMDASSSPILAGGIIGELMPGSPMSSAPAPGHSSLPAGSFPESHSVRSYVAPVGSVGRVGGSSQPANAGPSNGLPDAESSDPGGTSHAAGQTMLPPMAAASRAASGRSTVRPGGRAALWASQRRKRSSERDDPWSVPVGIPSVIEPPDPTDHDPGAGVIGIDR